MSLFNKTDFTVIIALIANVILFTGIFYYDLNRDVGPDGTPDIAVATLKINTVQRKYDSQLSWKNLYQNSPIKDGDTIRTDEDSDAIILFNDGTEIQLDENSLIQLNFNINPKINFDKGMVQIKSKSETINIQAKNKNLQVEQGQYRMERTGSEMMRFFSEGGGSSTVKINGKDFTITSSQELQIGEKVELKDKVINLIKPENQAKVLVNDKSGIINFAFILKKPFDPVYLEVSPKKDFSYVIKKTPISGDSASLQIETGIYYWRIRGKVDGKTYSSESRKFSVISDQSVSLYTPQNNSILPLKKETIPVFFSWSENSVNSTYKLEISKNENMKNPEMKEINYNSITVDEMKEGIYYWRVSTIPIFKNSQSKVSSIYKFTIGEKNRKEEKNDEKKSNTAFKESRIPPEAISPKDKDLSIKKDEPLNFSWQKQEEAVIYNFSLYDKNGKKKKIYEDKTKENQLKFKKFSVLQEGDFSWEVFGINEKGEHSQKTEGNFKIKTKDSLKKLKPEEIKITSPQTIYRD